MASEQFIPANISYKQFCALMDRYNKTNSKHGKKIHENKFKYKRVFDNKGK